MKSLILFIKILFVLLIIFFLIQYLYAYFILKADLNIFGLETADRNDGGMMLYQWYLFRTNGVDLIHYARVNIIADFFFIIAYVGVILIISYALMQKEKNPFLNNLLRLDILLAFIAGILDIIENIILLYDTGNYYPGEYFISSMWVSYPKWILIIWIILSWLISLSKRISS